MKVEEKLLELAQKEYEMRYERMKHFDAKINMLLVLSATLIALSFQSFNVNICVRILSMLCAVISIGNLILAVIGLCIKKHKLISIEQLENIVNSKCEYDVFIKSIIKGYGHSIASMEKISSRKGSIIKIGCALLIIAGFLFVSKIIIMVFV